MRKRFFRFLKVGLCCFPFFLSAQDAETQETEREEDHSSFIAFRTGVNFVGGGFNSEKTVSPQANSELSAALEGAWLPHRNIGMMVSVQYHQFQSSQIQPFSRPKYITGQSGDPWRMGMFLGGLYLSKPFLYFDLEGRFLGGVGNTQAFTKKYERQKSPLYQQFISYSGNSVWYQAGFTFRIDKKPGWSIAFNYDISFSNYTVQSREVYEGALSGEVLSESKVPLNFSVVSLSVVYAIPHYK